VSHKAFLAGGSRNMPKAYGVWAESEQAVLEELQRAIFVLQEADKFSRNVLRKLKEVSGILVSLTWRETGLM
jgi:hypothetical protein